MHRVIVWMEYWNLHSKHILMNECANPGWLFRDANLCEVQANIGKTLLCECCLPISLFCNMLPICLCKNFIIRPFLLVPCILALSSCLFYIVLSINTEYDCDSWKSGILFPPISFVAYGDSLKYVFFVVLRASRNAYGTILGKAICASSPACLQKFNFS